MPSLTHALEATARGGDAVKAATMGISQRLDASSAILTSMINQILTCNNKGKVYASDTSVTGRDADGCVSTEGAGGTICPTKGMMYSPSDPSKDADGCVTMSLVPSAVSVNLGSYSDTVPYSSGGASRSKSWNLSPLVQDGAASLTIRGNFDGVFCNNMGAQFVIPSVNADVGTTYICNNKHDDSPNRYEYTYYSWAAATKILTATFSHFRPYSGGTPFSMNGLTATYTATKMVIGSSTPAAPVASIP